MLIKICGIKDPDIAYQTAQLGASFVGIIFYPPSKRYVAPAPAREIADAVKRGYAQPVGVFVDQTTEEIQEICRETGIEIVQAYGLVGELPPTLRRIYVNAPEAPLRPHLDFLLMESKQPGTGQMVDLSHFVPPSSSHWLLAGGLNPGNVQEMIRTFRPFGVDVASGVEKDGKKDLSLIKQFINQVNSCV
jgi:phosphoribosylanthranilate isomerase